MNTLDWSREWSIWWDDAQVSAHYGCSPDRPDGPPPCARCGNKNEAEYFADGLCWRCHRHGPKRIDACRDCYAWGATRTLTWLCMACVGWRKNHRPGVCSSCHRAVTVDGEGFCRLCRRQATLARADHGIVDVTEANRHGQQLYLADLFGLHRTTPTHRPETRISVLRPLTHEQLVIFPEPVRDPAHCQPTRFPPPRDPLLFAYLDQQMREMAKRHFWSRHDVHDTRSSLRILLGIQETPGAAITASQTLVVRRVRGHSAARVRRLIEEAGFLTEDRPPVIEAWFTRRTQPLPTAMRTELRFWFDDLLHGRSTPPRRKPRHPRTIQSQYNAIYPILTGWVEQGHESLREITREHIEAALPIGAPGRTHRISSLRSVFRMLKANHAVFADPTIGVPVGRTYSEIPMPADLPALRRALSDATPGRAAVAALIGFHALTSLQIRNLLLTDLHDGRLELDGRIIPLATPVLERLADWLEHRSRRWPHTENPHLFISYKSAKHEGSVKDLWVTSTLGMSAQAIREDRILAEAHATGGDLRRLADLFGLSVAGAVRYTAGLDSQIEKPRNTPNPANPTVPD